MKKLYLLLFSLTFLFFIFLNSSCGKPETKTGCDCEGINVAKKTLIVGPTIPEDEYSTYDQSGALNADAACHASMELSFRWANDDKATESGERPPLYYEFQSLFGWFPTNQGMETTFVDNDGYHVWKILINEAIDKSTPEGSSYGIFVEYVGDILEDNANISCSISIAYNEYSEDAYLTGCTGY
ncbi:MAG: hypothetical protein KQH67_05945 [Bacteroidetes bacterium]|nr:hypothetical protein [Bacteroidota bacterium]